MTWQKKFSDKTKIFLWVVGIVVFSLISGLWIEREWKKQAPTWEKSGETAGISETIEGFQVVKVVDGDTIRIKTKEGTEQSVRLLAINAMELSDKNRRLACLAKTAKSTLSEKLNGRIVELRSDSKEGDTDRYGRWLRYVYLDNQSINQWLVEEGLAKVYREYPTAETEKLLGVEGEAMKAEKGMWGKMCLN